MNLKKAILLRSWIVFLLIVSLGVAVLWQIVSLQFYHKEKYEKISLAQSTKWREIEASRGNIFSEDGSLLATSIPKYEIRMDTKAEGVTNEFFFSKVDSLAYLMSLTFNDKSMSEWRYHLVNARNRGDRYLLIKRDVDYTIAKSMSKWPIFNLGKYKGGFIKLEKFKREIPFGDLARRTIGYTTESGVKIGLEGAFDSVLRGTEGKRLEQRIYGGVWKPIDDNAELDPKNGFDLYTTIDVNIQDVAESALKQCLINNNAHHGSAILMEVKTGAIKAIANLKKVGENQYVEAENYAINEFSDPGSTFKLISAMALLEDKHVQLEDTIDIEWGEMMFGPLRMVDAHKSPYKKVTFEYIFEHSSNVGIAKSVNAHYKLNPEKFLKYAFDLGLDKPLGFDIKSTRSPKLKNSKDKLWSSTALPFMSIGYEMELSSLQILNIYNTIANNGVMVEPFIVREIQEFGKTRYKRKVKVLNKKICSDETIALLRKLLEGVVEKGTGENLKGLNYKVAGKTGTAQIVLNNTGYNKNSHKASFVGYFPAENPQYSCIVVVNAPSAGVYYGGAVAGPVFKEIADKVFSTNLSFHQTLAKAETISVPKVKNGYRQDIKNVLNNLSISSQTLTGGAETEWVKARKDVQSVDLKELQTSNGLVPDVLGMGARDAIYLLENRGLRVIINGFGSVVQQSILPNTSIIKGSVIYLKLSL
ncbi:MAG: penicillin-binding transpeptidase domain-containing protein [Bacteroidota bacterium]|nr:penicillin-binding transpeptidase domain-containing protein [Bacteroidota bacterium]